MSIDAMKQVLAVMDMVAPSVEASGPRYYAAREALRAAIEQAEKPWVKTYAGGKPNYTVPEEQAQPRQWQGLTDEDVDEVERWIEFKEEGSGRIPNQKLVRYIERKLKEKNT
jgi:hypothetical protein